MSRQPPRSTLFPSSPLFRSTPRRAGRIGTAAPPRTPPPRSPPRGPRRRCPSGSPTRPVPPWTAARPARSEEHTSELQSRQYLVCRLLLEKKKHLHTHLSESV